MMTRAQNKVIRMWLSCGKTNKYSIIAKRTSVKTGYVKSIIRRYEREVKY